MAEELNDLLGKLSIRGKKKDIRSTDTKRSKKFEDELRKTDFHIFKSLNDFAYMKWNPKDSKPYKSLRDIEKSTEIACQIDFDGKPSLLKPMGSIRTPEHFITSLRGKEYDNDHLYGQTNAACLHTAVKRGLDLKDVDFVFGGSTLEMLANKDASDPFIATRVPGTNNCIMVAKKKHYTFNKGELGYQFERYVTGGDMYDTSDLSVVEHLHLMKVGDDYTVLFRAEADAIDENGDLVEIKASNPRYWGTKVMFQMISNGSATLCHGEKYRGVLQRVTLKSLSRVAKDAIYDTNRLEKNIEDGMRKLKNGVKSDQPYRISFSYSGNLCLTPVTENRFVLLPPEDIVLDLTKTSGA